MEEFKNPEVLTKDTDGDIEKKLRFQKVSLNRSLSGMVYIYLTVL